MSSFWSYAEEVWIDVRTPEEFNEGHVSGSLNIPHDLIITEIQSLQLTKDANIKLYCRSGRRSGLALLDLTQLGYTNVENVGGFEEAQARLNQ